VDAEQASSALRRALQSTSLPIVITCAMRRAPLRALREAGATAAGYNCTPWPDDASDADVVKADWGGLDPAAWAKAVPGARLRGGCCGTDARYLSALRETER
jgi:hypothetical protein